MAMNGSFISSQLPTTSELSIKLLLVNAHGRDDCRRRYIQEDRIKALVELIKRKKPDIVFFAEFKWGSVRERSWKNKGLPVEYRLYLGNKDACFLYNEEKVEPELDDFTDKMEKYYEPLLVRCCQMKIKWKNKELICISWHGPHSKLQAPEKDALYTLFRHYLHDLHENKALFIVGGDFNLDFYKLSKFFPAPFKCLKNKSTGRKEDKCFFITSELKCIELSKPIAVDWKIIQEVENAQDIFDHDPILTSLSVVQPAKPKATSVQTKNVSQFALMIMSMSGAGDQFSHSQSTQEMESLEDMIKRTDPDLVFVTDPEWSKERSNSFAELSSYKICEQETKERYSFFIHKKEIEISIDLEKMKNKKYQSLCSNALQVKVRLGQGQEIICICLLEPEVYSDLFYTLLGFYLEELHALYQLPILIGGNSYQGFEHIEFYLPPDFTCKAAKGSINQGKETLFLNTYEPKDIKWKIDKISEDADKKTYQNETIFAILNFAKGNEELKDDISGLINSNKQQTNRSIKSTTSDKSKQDIPGDDYYGDERREKGNTNCIPMKRTSGKEKSDIIPIESTDEENDFKKEDYHKGSNPKKQSLGRVEVKLHDILYQPTRNAFSFPQNLDNEKHKDQGNMNEKYRSIPESSKTSLKGANSRKTTIQRIVEDDFECGFCKNGTEAEDTCGELFHDNKTAAHLRCMQYSAQLTQYKSGSFGGFDIKAVQDEIRRGRFLKCHVCRNDKRRKKRRNGATAGCAIKSCRKTFHFYCAKINQKTRTERFKVQTKESDDTKIMFSVFCGKDHCEKFKKDTDKGQYRLIDVLPKEDVTLSKR